MLFLRRLETDHDRTPPSLRSSVTEKQAIAKHQACACFLHFLNVFERACPPTEYPEAAESLTSQFMSGYLDPDLGHILETSVPPGDLAAVAAFRPGPSNTITQSFSMNFCLSLFLFLADTPCENFIFCFLA